MSSPHDQAHAEDEPSPPTGLVEGLVARFARQPRHLRWILSLPETWEFLATDAGAELRDRLLAEEAAGAWVTGHADLMARLMESPAFARALADHPRFVRRLIDPARVIDWMLQEKGFYDQIMGDTGVHGKLISEGNALDELLWDDRVADKLLGEPGLLGRLLGRPRALDAILADGILLGRLLASQQARARIDEDAGLRHHLFPDETALERTLATPELLMRALRDPRLRDAIFFDEETTATLVWDERVMTRILADPVLLKRFVAQDRTLGRILADDGLLGKLLASERVRGRIAEDPRLRGALFTSGQAVERVLSDPRLILEFLSNRTVRESLINDNDTLAALVWDERVIERILGDAKLLRSLVGRDRALGRILADDALLGKVLGSDRARARIAEDRDLRDLLFDGNQAVDRVLRDGRLIRNILSNAAARSCLFSDDEILLDLLWDERLIEKVMGDAKLLKSLVSRDRALGRILADEALLTKVLRNPRAAEVVAENDEMAEAWFDHPPLRRRFIERLGATVATEGDDRLLETLLDRERWNADEDRAARIEGLIEFDRKLDRLRRLVRLRDGLNDAMRRDARASIQTPADVPEAIMRLFCDGEIAHFAHGDLRVPDRPSLWVVMHEILIDEEYYFESDEPAPRILDCGTHFGMALYYFKTLYPNARITGFEPVESLRQIALANVRDNGYADVDVLPYALSDAENELTFYLSDKDSMAGSLTERRRVAGDTVREVTVPTRRLSDYLDEPVHFLKLDIEGAEDRVLTEAGARLRNVQYLFCEYHHGYGLDPGRLATILRTLTDAGFDAQVAKSHSSHQFTSRRPMNAVGKAYSAVIWARNLQWPPKPNA